MVSKATLAIEWPVYRPRTWGQPSVAKALPRPWFGLDTERDAAQGNFVCGWAVGDTITLPNGAVSNVQRFHKFPDLVPGTYWVWNLAYDIEGMLRDLNIAEAWAAKSDGSQFPILEGNAIYYHGKRFDYRANKKRWSFIEASSFWGRRPLSEMGNKGKVDASKMSLARYLADSKYRQEVDTYCQGDARIVYDNITNLSNSLLNLGVNIGATPGATARRFMAKLGAFPEVLWTTHKAFLRSYCGGRFEITKRGVIPDARQYDIVSAYPWALAQCPWLTEKATWRMSRRLSENALYGSYEIAFSYDNYLGVAPRWHNGVRVYSKREERTWLARPEVEWLLNHGAKLEILRGVEVFDEAASDLWRDVITELFQLKQANKNTPDGGWGAKIILNSQYGVLIQLVRRSGKWVRAIDAVNPVDFAGLLALEEPPREFEGGKYFAPIYAGHLTSLTRCKLLDAAEEIGPEAYAGGHTDSILTTNKALLTGLGTELGDWKLEKHEPRADLSKTGMYALGASVKFRGITRKGTADLLWADNHTRNTRIGIKSAHSWDEVSVIVPKVVVNNYAIENKRLWHGEITRGLIAMEQFIDSEALQMVGT